MFIFLQSKMSLFLLDGFHTTNSLCWNSSAQIHSPAQCSVFTACDLALVEKGGSVERDGERE